MHLTLHGLDSPGLELGVRLYCQWSLFPALYHRVCKNHAPLNYYPFTDLFNKCSVWAVYTTSTTSN